MKKGSKKVVKKEIVAQHEKSQSSSGSYSDSSSSQSESSSSEEIKVKKVSKPKDKYASLNSKNKPIKKNITAMKVPKKPSLDIQYTEVSPLKAYKHDLIGMNEKDELLYNKSCANMENIKKIIKKIDGEISKIVELAQEATGAKQKGLEKKIDVYENDILQLNKLGRYYSSIYTQLSNKYK